MPISITCPICGHGKDVPDAFERRSTSQMSQVWQDLHGVAS